MFGNFGWHRKRHLCTFLPPFPKHPLSAVPCVGTHKHQHHVRHRYCMHAVCVCGQGEAVYSSCVCFHSRDSSTYKALCPAR